MTSTILSPVDVKEWLDASGISVSDWARQHGFPREIVYSLLSGRCRGRRGMAHRVALALGLKAAPDPLRAPPSVSCREVGAVKSSQEAPTE